ncbi:pyrroloquinoline quinone precursor peptide PqqA [Streptomyces sp. NPDC029674]|uniref:pyrroloquinoline quinone precursor peptide PqqA n=1 Tax=Streptomyces sp. NPDC029674 TaxID=3365297 RepID=UPI00384C8C73
MHHSTDQEKPAREPARGAAADAAADGTGWRTPEYAVVDTALEVTAYRLAER